MGPAGGEHDDGNGGAATELGEDFEAVEAGEHDVEEDEVEGSGIVRGEGGAGEAGGPVVDGVDGVARTLEEFGDELTETDVVVNDEDRCALGIFLFHAASVLPHVEVRVVDVCWSLTILEGEIW